MHTCVQKKRQKKEQQEQVRKRQAKRENLRWETFFLVTNGGHPDNNSPIRAGFFSISNMQLGISH